ncbi:MAG: hypothetical protein QXQ94_06160 [Candidatus Bathyarchaeia archaeon]
MDPINIDFMQLINLFEGETLRSCGELNVFVKNGTQVDPIKVLKLNNISSSSLGRYEISLCLDDHLLTILKEKESIMIDGYKGEQKEYLKNYFKAEFVDKRKKFLEHLDNLFRQGLRDVLICSGLYRPQEADYFVFEPSSTRLALIPDSGVIQRAILSKHILNRIVVLGAERFFVALPRLCLWELENMASDSKDALRKRKGYRGLQEINALRKYSSHIFDIPTPASYILPSKEGSRLSSDALIRLQIREYARAFSPLADAWFITCDKTSFAIAQLEGIKSYCLSIGDLFTIPSRIKVPSWDLLFGKVYTPMSTLVYELAIQYGSVRINSKENLEIWIYGDFPNKKADDWIRGLVQVDLRRGNIESLKEDLHTPSDNIKKVRENAFFW